MPDVLESRMIRHVRVHHGVFWCRCTTRIVPGIFSSFTILIIVITAALVRKVLRAFVFVRAAILNLTISVHAHFTDQIVCHVHIETSQLSH